jgi:hypothetical protein
MLGVIASRGDKLKEQISKMVQKDAEIQEVKHRDAKAD